LGREATEAEKSREEAEEEHRAADSEMHKRKTQMEKLLKVYERLRSMIEKRSKELDAEAKTNEGLARELNDVDLMAASRADETSSVEKENRRLEQKHALALEKI